MFRLLRGIARHLFVPISRPAALLLAWTHRFTVLLWVRSIIDEGRTQVAARAIDRGRWTRLATCLWETSTDPNLANRRELRRLTPDGHLITETDGLPVTLPI
jgi:hypothetical protein